MAGNRLAQKNQYTKKALLPPLVTRGGRAVGWSEDQDFRHQRDAGHGHKVAGQVLQDAHVRVSVPDHPGTEVFGDCCLHQQHCYAHSQVQHLRVGMPRFVDERLTFGPEHPREDRVDMLQMIAEIELVLDLRDRQRGGHFGIGLEQFEQR